MDNEIPTGPEPAFPPDGMSVAIPGAAALALGGRRCTNLPVRVVLADDECLFRASLRQLLAVPPAVIKEVYGVDVGAGFDVIGEAGTGEDTVRVVKSVHPELLLLDLSMPRMSGLDALRELEGFREAVRTIILAGTIDRPDLLAAVHLGVRGLLLKHASTEVMFEAIMCVMAGRCWLEQTLVTDLLDTLRPLIQTSSAAGGPSGRLTPRERQVLALVAAGYPNKEIARVCSVSEQTIKHHLTRMFDKVGASSRVELAMLAARQGLADSPDPRCEPAPPRATPMSSAVPSAMLVAPE
ncbi:MAG TPA: response regulator transcription factor [Vicinamibacterales bacterium]|nr:response regulator transcription factor [Vicinamibacterales bacterium]